MNGRLSLSLALLSAVAVCISGLELTEETKGYLEECQKVHHIQPEEIVAAVKDKKLPESENGRCFLECMMEKFGVLHDGAFDTEKANAIAATKLQNKPDVLEKATKIIETCNTEVKNPGGKCEYGVELAKCAMKYAKEMGIQDAPIGN